MTADHVILCLDRGSSSLTFADCDLAVAPPACPRPHVTESAVYVSYASAPA